MMNLDVVTWTWVIDKEFENHLLWLELFNDEKYLKFIKNDQVWWEKLINTCKRALNCISWVTITEEDDESDKHL